MNLFQQAQQLHQQNQLTEAESLYHQVIQQSPHFAEAKHLLGILLSQKGQHQEGAQWLLQAIEKKPTHPLYYHNLGKIYASARQWDAAIQAYQVAIKLAPKFTEAWYNISNAWKGKGDINNSIKSLQKAIKLNPKYAAAYYNLGNIYQETGRMKSALETYKKCLEVEPNYALAHNNIAAVLEHWDRYEEAQQHYQNALDINPNSREALSNLAGIYEKQGKASAAKKCFEDLLHRHPQHPANGWIHWHLAQISEIVWPDNPSIDHFRANLAANISKFYKKPPQLILADLHSVSIQPPFDLAYQGRGDRKLKEQYGQFFEQFFKQLRPQIHQGQQRQLRPSNRHIGLVVTSGHEGVFIKCMRGIINHLNTDLLRITIVCNAPNGGAVLQPAISNPKVQFLSIAKRLDIVIRQVHQAQFDILYYWEVGTDSLNYFLPFCRLAPVQCASWGWPVTSGIPTLDYFISCVLLETNEAANHYSEELIEFEKLPTYYYRPPVPKDLQPKSHFGLPTDKNLYLCAQNLRKVHPDMDELFLQILKKDPKGVLVFIYDKQATITEKLAQRLQKTCSNFFDRIHFLKRMPETKYLNLVAIADVVLDTLHYTGGANTAYDAFATGTPYVTLPTEFHRGRFGMAAYLQLGVTDLIAESKADYVEKAIQVANDKSYRADLKRQILEKSTAIFEDKQAVEELEDFFLNVK